MRVCLTKSELKAMRKTAFPVEPDMVSRLNMFYAFTLFEEIL